jgi:hypothetical protein
LCDFNIICGNSQDYGASIGKCTISKNGRNYLSSHRSRKFPVDNPSLTGNEDEAAHSIKENRKRHLSVDASKSQNGTSTMSPIHKKGTHDNFPTSTNSYHTLTMPSYCSVTKAAHAENIYNSTSDNSRNNNYVSACMVLHTSKHNKPCNKVVSFVDTSTAKITMSTISNDEKMIVPKQHTDLTQLMEQQIKDITSAMSQKYKSTIQQMQQTHIAQMIEIITKQKEQELDIENLQNTQMKIKENLEAKMDTKIEQQTNLLTSLVSMIRDLKEDKNNRNNNKTEQTTQSPTDDNNVLINPGDMTDCSYLEEEETSEHAESTDQSERQPMKVMLILPLTIKLILE